MTDGDSMPPTLGDIQPRGAHEVAAVARQINQDVQARLGGRTHPRIGGGTADYYKPPVAAYQAAYNAVSVAVQDFSVTLENGKQSTLGKIFYDRADIHENMRAYLDALYTISDSATHHVIFSDADASLAKDDMVKLLDSLGVLPRHIVDEGQVLPEQFQQLEHTILEAAKTAFEHVVAEDRAKATSVAR